MRFHLDSSVILLLRRGIHRGLTTLRREGGFATSLLALIGVAVLTQLFLLTWIGVHGIDSLLRAKTDVRLQVEEGAGDRAVQEFLVALRALPEVEDVEFITREEALEREKRVNPGLVSFLEQFDITNPFPDTVAVTLATLSQYDGFVAFVKQSQWRDVVDPVFLSEAGDQERELRQMLTLTDAGRSLAFLVLLLAGGILLFVVVELVRRRAFLRREEVFVERMSGAQEASVIVPFAVEASVLLFLAAGFSIAVLALCHFFLPLIIPAIAEGGTFDALRSEISGMLMVYGPLLLVAEIVLIPCIGFLGAYLGTRGQKLTLAAV